MAELLRHIVLFKFKETALKTEVEKIHLQFTELKNHISVIEDFEWGINDSPENFHQGFTHCYLVSFKSEEDRDKGYTPHSKHQEFVDNLQPLLEKVFVVDYWVNN